MSLSVGHALQYICVRVNERVAQEKKAISSALVYSSFQAPIDPSSVLSIAFVLRGDTNRYISGGVLYEAKCV